jgi:hypothetical protein
MDASGGAGRARHLHAINPNEIHTKGENIFLSFFKNPSYMSCRGTFEYLVARWNVLFPFGLDLLTHTQTHRDIRRNERKKKKKKKTPKNV